MELRVKKTRMPTIKPSATADNLYEETQDEKAQVSRSACQRNDFREPRLLHLPIPRKALNFVTWDIWFSLINSNLLMFQGFPDSSVGKKSTCNVGDPNLIPGFGRSSGEGIGYPQQYSGLENSQSQTQLSEIYNGIYFSMKNLSRQSILFIRIIFT